MPDPVPERLASELAQLHGALRRAARARLRNPDWADDAVSETVLAALESRPAFDEPARLRAWLFGVLRHKVVDQLRLHLGEAPNGPGSEAGPAEGAAGGDHGAAPPAHEPPQMLARTQLVATLERLLARLPPRQAQAFVMCQALGHSTEEACAALGLKPGALWVTLYRARLRLQQGLQGFV